MRITENEIIEYLQNAEGEYAPLQVDHIEKQAHLSEHSVADAFISFSISGGPRFQALVETVSVATPRNVLDKTRKLTMRLNEIKRGNVVPLLVAPYIGKKQMKILADKGISWIDLSGNMLIRVSNQLYIERTGKKNRFPDSAPIKKIFQGTSALVSRALLLKPNGFGSVNEIYNFINARNSSITLSTVSKVLKSLEEELLITKSENRISTSCAEKLLDRVLEGYKNSTERSRRNSYRYAIENLGVWNLPATGTAGQVLLAHGFYAAQIKGLAATEMKTVFVKDIEQLRRNTDNSLVKLIPDAEFGNYIITEANDPGIWFNADYKLCDSVVDDIELYLEMMTDTPRGPKIAEILKKRILEKAGPDG